MTTHPCPWQALADAWLALIAHRRLVSQIMARRHLPVILVETCK